MVVSEVRISDNREVDKAVLQSNKGLRWKKK